MTAHMHGVESSWATSVDQHDDVCHPANLGGDDGIATDTQQIL